MLEGTPAGQSLEQFMALLRAPPADNEQFTALLRAPLATDLAGQSYE